MLFDYNKTMKKLILLGICIFLVSMAYAVMPNCGNELKINQECMFITPPTQDCSTVDIILSDYSVDVNDGVTSELVVNTGIYNYSYTPTTEGGGRIVCVDNTSMVFNVINFNYATQINITDTNTTISPTDIHDTFDGDLQNIAIGMDANTSKILANSAWDTATSVSCTNADTECISEAELDSAHGAGSYETATGFSTPAGIQALSEGMDANRTALNVSISGVVDLLVDATFGLSALKDLIDAVSALVDNVDSGGIKTVYDWLVIDAQGLAEGLDANRSDLETHGDSAWATATGFETETNAALRVQALSKGMDDNRTTANETRGWIGDLIEALNDIVAADVWSVSSRTLTDGSNETLARIEAVTESANETRTQIIEHGDVTWDGTGGNETIGAIYDQVYSKVHGLQIINTTIDWIERLI